MLFEVHELSVLQFLLHVGLQTGCHSWAQLAVNMKPSRSQCPLDILAF